MKTKYWIILFSVLSTACLILSAPLLIPGKDAQCVEIISDGTVLQTLPLHTDCQVKIATKDGGMNTVTIQDGKVGVTDANCPDHYCMDRGMCSSGAQIVCLPNRLIVRFQGHQAVDFAAG